MYLAGDTEALLFAGYRRMLKTRDFVNRSAAALDQCLLIEYNVRGGVRHGKEDLTDDPSGAKVNHADMCVADAICARMVKKYLEPSPAEVREEIRPDTLAWRHKRYEDERRNVLWSE